ncbi:MAG TPA: hypothetical protein VJ742_12475 [Nitrososphaera sp.]|nr:hypothetical protein [Nitrososphaera sp.]
MQDIKEFIVIMFVVLATISAMRSPFVTMLRVQRIEAKRQKPILPWAVQMRLDQLTHDLENGVFPHYLFEDFADPKPTPWADAALAQQRLDKLNRFGIDPFLYPKSSS